MKIETRDYVDGKPVESVEKKPQLKKNGGSTVATKLGRPAHVQYSEWKQMSKKALMIAIAEMLTRPMGEVDFIAADPSTMGARALVASTLKNGVYTGSVATLQIFLSYCYGKPIDFDPQEDKMDPEERANAIIKKVPSEVIEGILRGLAIERSKASESESE